MTESTSTSRFSRKRPVASQQPPETSCKRYRSVMIRNGEEGAGLGPRYESSRRQHSPLHEALCKKIENINESSRWRPSPLHEAPSKEIETLNKSSRWRPSPLHEASSKEIETLNKSSRWRPLPLHEASSKEIETLNESSKWQASPSLVASCKSAKKLGSKFLSVLVPSEAVSKCPLSVSPDDICNLAGFLLNHSSILRAVSVNLLTKEIYYEISDMGLDEWLDLLPLIKLCHPPGYTGRGVRRPSEKVTILMRELIYVVNYIHSKGFVMRGLLQLRNIVITDGKLQLKDVLLKRSTSVNLQKEDFAQVRSFLIDNMFGNIKMAFDVEHFLELLKDTRCKRNMVINHPVLWTVEERADMYEHFWNDPPLYSHLAWQLDYKMNKRGDTWEWKEEIWRQPFMPISEFYFERDRRDGGAACNCFLRAFRGHAGRYKSKLRFNFTEMEEMISIDFPEMLVWMVEDLIAIGCFELLPRYRHKLR